ncbi:MAG: hypothetical protein AABO57_05920 [Acidobacteriota bacterium]
MDSFTIGILQSYTEMLSRVQDSSAQLRNSSLTRFVWIVAIDGFAVINMKAYSEGVLHRAPTRCELTFLLIPWLFSALAAVIAHFFVDEAAVKDLEYTIGRVFDLQLQRIRTAEVGLEPEELMKVLNDPKWLNERAAVTRSGKWVRRLELTSFGSLVLAFIGSSVYLLAAM